MKKKYFIYVLVLLALLMLFLVSCSSKVTQINSFDSYIVERVEKIKGSGQVVLKLTSETTGSKYSVLIDDKNQKKGDRVVLTFDKVKR